MSNFSKRLGPGSKFRTFGTGAYVRGYPDLAWIKHRSFASGYVALDARQDVDQASTPRALDVMVTEKDEITPVPGTTQLENWAGHTVEQIAIQASLDNTSEIILFSPPHIGVKFASGIQWYDVGLPAMAGKRFSWTNFAGDLLFGNGIQGLYVREPNKNTVELIEKAPAAEDYVTFANRVFALNAVIAGNRQALGVAWSAANSDYKDWTSTGQGFELLIDDMSSGDHIIAGRSMGLDTLAVLLRNSIWIGRRTNRVNRPADFQPRVPGIGAVNAACAKTSRFGVIFLSDTGVYLFDGNSAISISDQINAELLPLDLNSIDQYSAFYNPLNRTYYLFTPSVTWVCEIEKRRWHRRSIRPKDAVLFAEQFAPLTWAEITGTWASKQLTWQDLRPEEADSADLVFLGTNTLHYEDPASSNNFGVAMQPYWEFPAQETEYNYQLLTAQVSSVEYSGEGIVELHTANNAGDLTYYKDFLLGGTGEARTLVGHAMKTGRGTGSKLVFLGGKPKISRVEIGYLPRGPRIETPGQVTVTLTDTGLIVSGYYTDFSLDTVGQIAAGWLQQYGQASHNWIVASESGATGGKIFKCNCIISGAVGSYQAGAYWQAAGNPSNNVEVATRFRVNSSNISQEILHARVQPGTVGTQQWNGYRTYQNPGGTTVATAFGNTTGGLSIFSPVANFVMQFGVWLGSRLRVNGTTVQMKIWLWDSNSPTFGEPVGWMTTNTATNVTGNGYGGLSGRTPGNPSSVDFDRFGIGFAGDTAPLKPAVDGWIIPATGYSVMITGVPRSITVRAGGLVFENINGSVIIQLAATPAQIEFLRGAQVFATYTSPLTNRKQYAFSYTRA